MTREEEIKEQAEKKALEPSRLMHPYANQYKVMSAYEIGFIEGAVWADAHPHWISVEDELPKKDGRYLFYDEVLGPQVSVYYDGCTFVSSITHWMPLPQAPHHIIDANKKVDRVIGTADHIKTALDVLNTKGGENDTEE